MSENIRRMQRQIDINDLFEKKVRREEMRLSVYDTILERVHKRIKQVASEDGGTTFLAYVLPEVMIGQPLFNAEQCRSFVVTSLVKNGFRVQYTHPNLIMISWDHLREKYEKAKHVIEEEQKTLIESHNRLLLEDYKTKEKETNERHMIRHFNMMREEESTLNNVASSDKRRLLRATEEYIPSAQLRNVFFQTKDISKNDKVVPGNKNNYGGR
jgi:hypothetical protein